MLELLHTYPLLQLAKQGRKKRVSSHFANPKLMEQNTCPALCTTYLSPFRVQACLARYEVPSNFITIEQIATVSRPANTENITDPTKRLDSLTSLIPNPHTTQTTFDHTDSTPANQQYQKPSTTTTNPVSNKHPLTHPTQLSKSRQSPSQKVPAAKHVHVSEPCFRHSYSSGDGSNGRT